jgi:DNA adenine methylase
MVTYSGGKSRNGKTISKIIKGLEIEYGYTRDEILIPFCGMLGVSIHFSDRKITANDLNPDLIQLWRKLQDGWNPPKDPVSATEYSLLKTPTDSNGSEMRALMCIGCAYSGIFMAGYRKDRVFYDRFRKSLVTDFQPFLENITFSNGDYRDLRPHLKTIYVDPPYIGNNFRSDFFKDFDHVAFWDTMRKWSADNLVIISEYEAPADFKEVWSKSIAGVYSGKSRVRVEKLFIFGG